MSIAKITINQGKVILAAAEDKNLLEVIESLRSVLGPWSTNLLKTSPSAYGSSVVSCKAGKAYAVMKLLEQLGYRITSRPSEFTAVCGSNMVAAGIIFVNYNEAIGTLLLGTTIQKNPPL